MMMMMMILDYDPDLGPRYVISDFEPFMNFESNLNAVIARLGT